MSDKPIPAPENAAYVVFEASDTTGHNVYYVYQQQRFNVIRKRFLEATYGINVDHFNEHAQEGQMVAMVGNKRVAILMPSRINVQDAGMQLRLEKPPLIEDASEAGLLNVGSPIDQARRIVPAREVEREHMIAQADKRAKQPAMAHGRTADSATAPACPSVSRATVIGSGKGESSQKFHVTTPVGADVEVTYTPEKFGQVDHFEFRGKAISETGYRSEFRPKLSPGQDPMRVAKEFVAVLEKNMIADQRKRVKAGPNMARAISAGTRRRPASVRPAVPRRTVKKSAAPSQLGFATLESIGDDIEKQYGTVTQIVQFGNSSTYNFIAKKKIVTVHKRGGRFHITA